MHHATNMPYTLWSRDQLLGETDLGFVFREFKTRTGWLHPTELGERLLPIAAGVAPAMRAEFFLGPDPTLKADIISACDQEQALGLELRGPNGQRIDTKDIGIIDTHYLLSIADHDSPDDEKDDVELTPEEQAGVDEMLAAWEEARAGDLDIAPEEELELPRYQIQVWLVDDRSVP